MTEPQRHFRSRWILISTVPAVGVAGSISEQPNAESDLPLSRRLLDCPDAVHRKVATYNSPAVARRNLAGKAAVSRVAERNNTSAPEHKLRAVARNRQAAAHSRVVRRLAS